MVGIALRTKAIRSMNRFFTIITCVITLLFSHSVAAQDSWVQIQARPDLALAKDSARSFSGQIEDVNGFTLQTGWFAIALGPYSEFEAEQGFYW